MSGADNGLFGMGLGMWFFWIALIVTLVVVIKVLIGGSPGSKRERIEDQVETLKERYARGEIDEDEFNRRLGELDK